MRQAVEAADQLGRRGLGGNLHELAVSLRHVQFQDVVVDQEAMDWERVDQLVGDKASFDAGHGHSVGLDAVVGPRHVTVPNVFGAWAGQRSVYRDVPDGFGEPGFQGGGVRGDVGRQPPIARAQLHDVEARGPAQDLPHALKLDGQQGAECGMSGWTRVEVSLRADSPSPCVVAPIGMVEGDAHELGEGDPAVLGYSGPDLLFGARCH